MVQQVASGWGFPNALLQHAIGDLEELSIDVGAHPGPTRPDGAGAPAMGYEVTEPEGTFYLMVRSPDPDDMAFTDRLAELGRPGPARAPIVECPGWFRISLTASDAMVERGLEAFRAAV